MDTFVPGEAKPLNGYSGRPVEWAGDVPPLAEPRAASTLAQARTACVDRWPDTAAPRTRIVRTRPSSLFPGALPHRVCFCSQNSHDIGRGTRLKIQTVCGLFRFRIILIVTLIASFISSVLYLLLTARCDTKLLPSK